MKPRKQGVRHPKRSVKAEQGGMKYATAFLKAVVAGLLVTTLLLLLCSFVMSRQSLSFSLVNPMAVGSLVMGAMTAGFLAARLLRERGMAVGAGAGLILYLMVLLGAAIMNSDFGATMLIKLVIAVVSGAIGGILGVNARARRKK